MINADSTPIPSNAIIRAATPRDQIALSNLINFEYFVHRHLDWRTPIDWLGEKYFWFLESEDRILAALALPPDPENICWVRLFAVSSNLNQSDVWKMLFSQALSEMRNQPQMQLAAVALQGWFSRILKSHGFVHHQDIVVLAWEEKPFAKRTLPPGLQIRVMQTVDLPEVLDLDKTSFAPLWGLSLEGIKRAYQQSSYATVVVAPDTHKLIGYQISTATDYSAHLARLGVDPAMQKQGIGYCLVTDLLEHFQQKHTYNVTVNTQNDNLASLALYKKLGFFYTGEQLPVFVYPR